MINKKLTIFYSFLYIICLKRVVILSFIAQSCFMMIDLVKYPVLTEKSARLIENNQYTFDVDLRLSKPQIKKLIEELFEVVVISVNTHRPPRKKKRLGLSQGFKTSYKRVIVTVKSGQSSKIFPEI